MGKRYFGTDGIRGLANEGMLTPEMAMKVGQAAGRHFLRGAHRHRVLVGKDTRLSGYMLEQAMTAGFTSAGMDVIQVGPMPTPAIALLTREMRADLGVMISASHNPFHDNGIKLFGPDGYKLSDEDEAAIEALMEEPARRAAPAEVGRARRIDDASGRYIHAVKASLPDRVRLDGLKVVVDCAHGAAYRLAPVVLWELGADVVAMGVAPDGFNINDAVGSTWPEAMAAEVHRCGADIGLALDGDADRLIVADETGRVIDGDQLIATIAASLAARGRLKGGAVAATVMSNMGLERHLEALGLGLHRTAVGDRHVLAAMRERGLNLGGEQSGHIILGDHATTGDGLLAALQLLAVMVRAGRPASETLHRFEPWPQMLRNVRCPADVMSRPPVVSAIAEAEARLAGRGRLLVRPSGTEPLLRVMVEAEDPELVEETVEQLCAAARRAA